MCSHWYYYWKSFKWTFYNALCGLLPLLLVGAVANLTKGSEGQEQFEDLIYEGGLVLFVSIAIMGAVAVDYIVESVEMAGTKIILIFGLPLFLTATISL